MLVAILTWSWKRLFALLIEFFSGGILRITKHTRICVVDLSK
jgi:hypothetical protein